MQITVTNLEANNLIVGGVSANSATLNVFSGKIVNSLNVSTTVTRTNLTTSVINVSSLLVNDSSVATMPLYDGAFKFIEKATITGSTSSVTFDGLNEYIALRIKGIDVWPETTNTTFDLTLSADNGASYFANSYSYQVGNDWDDNGNVRTRVATTKFSVGEGHRGRNVDNRGNRIVLNFETHLTSFNLPAFTKLIDGYASFTEDGGGAGNLILVNIQGVHAARIPLNGIKLQFSSGNIANGTIILEGMTL